MRRPAWIIVSLLVLGLGLGLWSQYTPVTAALAGASSIAPATVFAPPANPAAPGSRHTDAQGSPSRLPAFLPAEAEDVLERIARGGPFAYRQDGSVFHNREHRLPSRPLGYYHEYTVATPGSSDRGARRIISGGEPGSHREYWYTGDHYRSFQRFEVSP